MKLRIIWLNRISLMAIILLIGIGWIYYWPVFIELWNYLGAVSFVYWFIAIFTMLVLSALLYFSSWCFTHDIPFGASLFEIVRNIGVKRWIRIIAITVVATPPYLLWMVSCLK